MVLSSDIWRNHGQFQIQSQLSFTHIKTPFWHIKQISQNSLHIYMLCSKHGLKHGYKNYTIQWMASIISINQITTLIALIYTILTNDSDNVLHRMVFRTANTLVSVYYRVILSPILFSMYSLLSLLNSQII